jgi:hypothetical protein
VPFAQRAVKRLFLPWRRVMPLRDFRLYQPVSIVVHRNMPLQRNPRWLDRRRAKKRRRSAAMRSLRIERDDVGMRERTLGNQRLRQPPHEFRVHIHEFERVLVGFVDECFGLPDDRFRHRAALTRGRTVPGTAKGEIIVGADGKTCGLRDIGVGSSTGAGGDGLTELLFGATACKESDQAAQNMELGQQFCFQWRAHDAAGTIGREEGERDVVRQIEAVDGDSMPGLMEGNALQLLPGELRSIALDDRDQILAGHGAVRLPRKTAGVADELLDIRAALAHAKNCDRAEPADVIAVTLEMKGQDFFKILRVRKRDFQRPVEAAGALHGIVDALRMVGRAKDDDAVLEIVPLQALQERVDDRRVVGGVVVVDRARRDAVEFVDEDDAATDLIGASEVGDDCGGDVVAALGQPLVEARDDDWNAEFGREGDREHRLPRARRPRDERAKREVLPSHGAGNAGPIFRDEAFAPRSCRAEARQLRELRTLRNLRLVVAFVRWEVGVVGHGSCPLPKKESRGSRLIVVCGVTGHAGNPDRQRGGRTQGRQQRRREGRAVEMRNDDDQARYLQSVVELGEEG